MKYLINYNLLSQSRISLSKRSRLYWVVGGSGSGKTTVCRNLSERFGIPGYDMDAHIYGAYHSRFTPERHPVNYAWTTAQNSLKWLLSMTWEEFNSFNQAALPEYLDLLSEDLQSEDLKAPLLIDGGICHPCLLAQVIPANQIVCLSNPQHSSEQIWENKERRSMKELIYKLPKPAEAWRTFLEFDKKINQTMLRACKNTKIVVCTRNENESPTTFSNKVARVLEIRKIIP